MEKILAGEPWPESKNFAFVHIDKRQKELNKTWSREAFVAKKMSHSGPCIPGKTRLLVDTEGKFMLCERVSEASEVMNIGNIHTGIDLEKAMKLLNICQINEERCKNCWAILNCQCCAKFCYYKDDFSPAVKMRNCVTLIDSVEKDLKEYIFFKEQEGGLIS